jgi:formylmethanofuran:tetrahydromethanopterin formyltransferase
MDTTNEEEEDEDDIPEQIETVIEILLNGLRDKVRTASPIVCRSEEC